MATHLIELFRETTRRSPHHPMLAWRPKEHAPFVSLTYLEVSVQADHLASWLLARGLAGKRVLLLSDTTREWLVADLACLTVGAVDVPRGATLSPRELKIILRHSGAQGALVQNQTVFDKLPRAFALRKPVLVFKDFSPRPKNVALFEEVVARPWAPLEKVRQREKHITPDTLATLVYTSGTTGDPKGVMLTHRNFMHNCRHLPRVLELREHESYLALLPLWHLYERTCEYLTMGIGATFHYTTKRHLKEDIKEVRPTIFPSAPAVWINVHHGFMDRVEKSPIPQRLLAKGLLAAAITHVGARRRLRGETCDRLPAPPPAKALDRLAMALTKPLFFLARALVFKPLIQGTGGRLTRAVSGGGALPDTIDDFFEAAGLPLLNGYGMTETSPVISVRLPSHNIRGTIGPPLPEIDLRIIDPDTGRELPRLEIGFIQVKGPSVMGGYYKNPRATRAVLSKKGALHTGDLGYIDRRGYLVYTGRRKEIIVLSSGENVWPHVVEDALLRCRDIAQCMLVGQDRKVPGMLVVPQMERLLALAARQNLHHLDTGELLRHPIVKAHFQKQIHQFINENPTLQPCERVGHFALLEKPFTEGDELTQTLKIRRDVVLSKYAHLIDHMYG